MSERKTFDAAVIGSITSGVVLVQDFGKVHEAIEWLAGHPVWTHELPSVSRRLAPELLKQFPDLPARDTIKDWKECAAVLAKEYPRGIQFPRGTGERTADPVTTAVQAMQGEDAAP